MKTWNKIRMWFWSKNRTIEEIIRINKIIDIHTKRLVSQLESLDQGKVYVCKLPRDVSKEELLTVKEAFDAVAIKMKWTMPKIIFLNSEFEEKGKESE